MKKILKFFLIIVLLFLYSMPVFAQRGGRGANVIDIRLASFIPRETPTEINLDKAASEILRATNNEIRLIVSPNGREGNSSQVAKRLMDNSIQAAMYHSIYYDTLQELGVLQNCFVIKGDIIERDSVLLLINNTTLDKIPENHKAQVISILEQTVFNINADFPPSTIIDFSLRNPRNPFFTGDTFLTKVTIPNSVTGIGYQAFKDCTSLTTVTIPNSVTTIWSNAFSGCTSLTTVTLQANLTKPGLWVGFASNAFPGNLQEVYFSAGGGVGTYTRAKGSNTWKKQ